MIEAPQLPDGQIVSINGANQPEAQRSTIELLNNGAAKTRKKMKKRRLTNNGGGHRRQKSKTGGQ